MTEHPKTQSPDLAGGKINRDTLAPRGSKVVDLIWTIDPNLLDLWIIKQWLQDPEPLQFKPRSLRQLDFIEWGSLCLR
jgi:hypothetical protein